MPSCPSHDHAGARAVLHHRERVLRRDRAVAAHVGRLFFVVAVLEVERVEVELEVGLEFLLTQGAGGEDEGKGRREAEEGTVALRRLGSKDQTVMSADDALALLADEAKTPAA